MAKIQCPHCKATNQDASLEDPCWQCGTILGAPPSAIETGAGPPTSAANATNVPAPSVAPVQAQLPREQPAREQLTAPDRRRVSGLNAISIAALVIVCVILVVAVLVFLRR